MVYHSINECELWVTFSNSNMPRPWPPSTCKTVLRDQRQRSLEGGTRSEHGQLRPPRLLPMGAARAGAGAGVSPRNTKLLQPAQSSQGGGGNRVRSEVGASPHDEITGWSVHPDSFPGGPSPLPGSHHTCAGQEPQSQPGARGISQLCPGSGLPKNILPIHLCRHSF